VFAKEGETLSRLGDGSVSAGVVYSNAGGKRRYLVALSGTQRIQAAISERAARAVNRKVQGSKPWSGANLAFDRVEYRFPVLKAYSDRTAIGMQIRLIARRSKRRNELENISRSRWRTPACGAKPQGCGSGPELRARPLMCPIRVSRSLSVRDANRDVPPTVARVLIYE
jgi:hypothetical protein